MSDFDLVIRGGTVATAADVMRCDIGIRRGTITALGERLGAGEAEIDAHDRFVLPGGVDGHCHIDQPLSGGAVMADDFRSGSVAAACGGTTTIIPFACQMRGGSMRAAVNDYHRRASGKAVIDYAFHLILCDPTDQVLGQEMPTLVREGFTSVKIYMTHDDLKISDRQILDVLDFARAEQIMVMIHCENSDCIAWLTERLERTGQTEPRFHAASRPPVVEREATHRAISLAELIDVPILIVHVSGGEAIEQVREAQARGLQIYAETCPQYLFLTAADLDRPGFEGARCICSPPPRDKATQQLVWNALCDGVLQIFSSDHAPYRYEDSRGKMLHGSKASFQYVPNGIPGIETRLPLLFSEGVMKGRLEITRFVAVTATNPARMYGLYPRKGTIAIGSDADLVIWDPERHWRIQNDSLHHAVDYTPYEGMELLGFPEIVISRGEIVVDRGEPVASAGRGIFIKCGKPDPALCTR